MKDGRQATQRLAGKKSEEGVSSGFQIFPIIFPIGDLRVSGQIL